MEVTKNKSKSLNDIFAYFAENNIAVESMRNKTNRLEELFLGMVEK